MNSSGEKIFIAITAVMIVGVLVWTPFIIVAAVDRDKAKNWAKANMTVRIKETGERAKILSVHDTGVARVHVYFSYGYSAVNSILIDADDNPRAIRSVELYELEPIEDPQ